MVDLYDAQYVICKGTTKRDIDMLDESARRRLLERLLERCDVSEPTIVRLKKDVRVVALSESIVRYRLELSRVQKMESVMLVPRETEYDRSLWAIARERLGVRWRRMKRWFYGRSN